MHHELPDLLVPYKRHCSTTVENIVEGAPATVYCEAGTIKKIAMWFRERSRYFFGCIESVLGCNGFAGNVSSVSLLQRIKVAVDIFTEAAMNEIYNLSSGSPRLINKLCTNCLIYGATMKHRLIDDHMDRLVVDGEMS